MERKAKLIRKTTEARPSVFVFPGYEKPERMIKIRVKEFSVIRNTDTFVTRFRDPVYFDIIITIEILRSLSLSLINEYLASNNYA